VIVRGNGVQMNPVLMDLVVRLAATVDELLDDDKYARGAQKVLESMVADLEKLDPDERRELVAHVQGMAAQADRNPLASDGIAGSWRSSPPASASSRRTDLRRNLSGCIHERSPIRGRSLGPPSAQLVRPPTPDELHGGLARRPRSHAERPSTP
jgi:hypothetical protein